VRTASNSTAAGSTRRLGAGAASRSAGAAGATGASGPADIPAKLLAR
jgi:hypothetical protein